MNQQVLFIAVIMAMMAGYSQKADALDTIKDYRINKIIGDANKNVGADIEYKTYRQLCSDVDNKADKEMLSADKKSELLSKVPQGGQITILIKGSTVERSRLGEWTLLIKDESDKELLRKTSNYRRIQHDKESWVGVEVVLIPFSVPATFNVHLIPPYQTEGSVFKLTTI